jgi:transmembrane sensor
MIAALLRGNRPKTAAEWFAARRGGIDAKLDRQFRDWLAQDPAHGEEYALCEITWEVSHEAAKEMQEPHRRRPAGGILPARRAAAFALSAAAAAAAAITVWLWTAATLAYATAPGEQRTVTLQDGSRITLNTRTRITVHFTRRAREVALDRGEAFFEVAKNATRPFTVRTLLGSARAVGTRFDVYLEDRSLSVTTEEGEVQVDGVVPGNGVLVDAGRHAELRPGMTRALVEPANMSAALGWLTRRLEVDNEPLGEVLEDFSRYTAMPLRADTPAIAALRVSAVLSSGDLDALQATLRGAFGLDIQQRGGELVVLDPKSGAGNAD